jgi:hypothetical protein
VAGGARPKDGDWLACSCPVSVEDTGTTVRLRAHAPDAEGGRRHFIAPAPLRGASWWGYLTEKKLVLNVQFPLSSIAWISSSYSVFDWRKAAGMGTILAEAGSSTW